MGLSRSRKRRENMFPKLEDAEELRGEDLAEILENNKDRFKALCLVFVWCTSYHGYHPAVGEADMNEEVFDSEYCMTTADFEDAMDFAENYDCWDGQVLHITKEGLIYGYKQDDDMDVSQNDGYCHQYKGGCSVDDVETIYIVVCDPMQEANFMCIDMADLRNACKDDWRKR